MIEIGKINKLPIAKFVDFGAYLDAGNDVEILMPRRYVTEDMKEGDVVDVFIYTDSEDRLVATTENPKAMVGDFAFLRVVAVNSVGAFMDWGLLKDILVPFREQKVRMEKDRYYVVYIYLDDNTKRVVASAKLDKFLDNRDPAYQPEDEVEILIVKKTDLGYKVIIDNLFSGMIYHNEIFGDINIGERHKAFIKNVRPDGKIDVTLGNKAKERCADVSDDIISFLKDNNGEMRYNDKSSPEDIKEIFHCSKKDFKKAIGGLLKNKKISLVENGVKLLK